MSRVYHIAVLNQFSAEHLYTTFKGYSSSQRAALGNTTCSGSATLGSLLEITDIQKQLSLLFDVTYLMQSYRTYLSPNCPMDFGSDAWRLS